MIDYLTELREYFRLNPYLPREEIHSRFGGNPQKSITPSSTYPVIFLFTSIESARRGDWGWWNQDDGFFHYIGDGPTGDMQLIKGNLAVTEHKQDQRILMLFEPADCGELHFLGEFEYVDYYQKEMTDSDSHLRKGIIFRLRQVKTEPAQGCSPAEPIPPERSQSVQPLPEKKSFNKRKHLRWKADITVKYKFLPENPDSARPDKIYIGVTRDISIGGILLDGPIPHQGWLADLLVHKTAIGLNFFMPDDEKIIKALAQVAWIKMRDIPNLRCVMGLKFKQISEEDSERLKKLIVHLQIKSKQSQPSKAGPGADGGIRPVI